MGIANLFLKTEPSQLERLPEVKDDKLQLLTDTQLTLLALARWYEAYRINDEALIVEMYRRAGGRR